MAKTKKKISKIKTKKKIWFKIFAPKLFGQKEMGESYLSAADQAVGRKLKVNMKELTGPDTFPLPPDPSASTEIF